MNETIQDEKLVQAIVRADKTAGQIGEEFDLSAEEVRRIIRGDDRPQLQAALQAGSKVFVDDARRLAAATARHAVAMLLKLASPSDDESVSHETRRKAALDIIKYASDEFPVLKGKLEVQKEMPQMSEEATSILRRELGGPDK